MERGERVVMVLVLRTGDAAAVAAVERISTYSIDRTSGDW